MERQVFFLNAKEEAARSPPLLCGRLIALEDRLLRERCLRRHEMGALQLKSKGRAGQRSSKTPEKIDTSPRSQFYGELVERRNNSQIF
jgi:hypothetical protein